MAAVESEGFRADEEGSRSPFLESSVPVSHRSPRRRSRIAAITAVVLFPLLVPTVASADDEPARGDTVVGELVQAWPEHENHDEAVARADDGPLTWIETASGDTVRVSTDDLTDGLGRAAAAGGLPVGATVEVVVGNRVANDPTAADGLEPALEVVSAEVVTAAPAVEPPLAAAATDEVTVVMVIPAGGAPEPGRTLAQVETAVNGPVAAFWSEQSGDVVRIATAAGNDPAWFQATADCSKPYDLWAEAAAHAHWTLATGKHLLVYLPRNSAGCAYGLAQVGNSLTGGGKLYVTDVATSVIAHELGHNFGLGHSSGRQCDLGTEAGTCRTEAYRDYYDVMGVSWQQVGSLNAAQAARLGLIPAGEQQVVTPPATPAAYPLAPIGGTTGTRALSLTDADGSVYWLEYRIAVGQDAWLGTTANRFGLDSGVQMRRAGSGSDTSLLLDPTPSGSAAWPGDVQVALPVGVPVSMPSGKYTLTVQSADASGASVRFSPTGGDASCARRPSVPSSGVSLLETPGGPVVLGVGGDRGVWFRPIDGSGVWSSLGGGVLFGPTAINAGSKIYLFAIGTDNVLYMRFHNGTGWLPWTALGGHLTSSPAAASLGEGHVRVFARGGDGALWSREAVNGVWSPWTSLGGYVSGQPAAAADTGAGVVRVSVRGFDGQVYGQALAVGASPGSYVTRDLAVCSSPALATVQVPGAAAEAAYLDSSASPRVLDAGGAELSIGGRLTSTPAVDSAAGSFLVAGRGGDNALWLYDGRPGGAGWMSLGGRLL